MLARFYKAGTGKNVAPHDAFQNAASWVEYGPIISWEYRTSTVDHSAEAMVWIPLHGGITPASNTYGQASINAGDHVFLKDNDSVALTFMHGTVDKIEYKDQLLGIHFRNPLSWLSDNYVTRGLPVDQSPNSIPSVVPLVDISRRTQHQYVPNYINHPDGGVTTIQVITDLVTYLAGRAIGGPFSYVNYGQSNPGGGGITPPGARGPFYYDGGLIHPNFDLTSRVTILDAIVGLARSVNWGDGIGHEILANATSVGVTGFGFSTELFIFRRGYYTFSTGFSYGDTLAGEIPIISYSFPEQSFDMGTTGEAIGQGGLTLDKRQVLQKLSDTNPQLAADLSNLIARGDATGLNRLFSAGRGISLFNPAYTNYDDLQNALLGELKGIGQYRGPRVGEIKVAGWVSNQLFPGFKANVRIAPIGVDTQYVIDEVSYSEPEGITTIRFNRKAEDTIESQIRGLDAKSNMAASMASAYADSGWFRPLGQDGSFDINAARSAPAKSAGIIIDPADSVYQNAPRIVFQHRMGRPARNVIIEAGLIEFIPGTDVDWQTITEVQPATFDYDLNNYYGYVCIENTETQYTIVLNHWLCFSDFIQRRDGGGWYANDYDNLYMRIRVSP